MYLHKPYTMVYSWADLICPVGPFKRSLIIYCSKMSGPYLRHNVPFLLQSAKDDKKQNNLLFHNPSIMSPLPLSLNS